MKIKKVKPEWMVLARHFGMDGGIFDYGTADIKGFFGSFEEADIFAKELFERTQKYLLMPFVWVLKCEKTYQKGGIAVTRKNISWLKSL